VSLLKYTTFAFLRESITSFKKDTVQMAWFINLPLANPCYISSHFSSTSSKAHITFSFKMCLLWSNQFFCTCLDHYFPACHRITQKMELERTSGHHLSLILCLKQGQIAQAFQACVQLGFNYLQGWTVHRLSGHLVPVFDHPQ